VEFIKKLFLDVRIPFWHFLGIKCFNGIFRWRTRKAIGTFTRMSQMQLTQRILVGF
jgi:hypothetical protein